MLKLNFSDLLKFLVLLKFFIVIFEVSLKAPGLTSLISRLPRSSVQTAKGLSSIIGSVS